MGCQLDEEKEVDSNVIWINLDKDNQQVTQCVKDLDTIDSLKIKLYNKINDAINHLKDIRFVETKVIVCGNLYSELILTFRENILDMYIAPKIIVFTDDSKNFAESNKDYQDKNNTFYKYGGIATRFEEIKEFLKNDREKIVEKEDEREKKLNESNEVQLTFEYIDCKEKLLLPLFFKVLIDKTSNDKTKKYNNMLYNKYSDENDELKILLGAIKSMQDIPAEILSKFYARLYTADSSFHRNINKDLGLNKSDRYLWFIKTLYEGVKLKSLSLASNNILYRVSLISIDEIKKIKNYLNKKQKNLPASIVFCRAFLSFSKSKKVAEGFLKYNNNNKNLCKVFFIVEKDDNIGFNLSTHGDIEKISYFPEEEEVLFFPFSSFEIKTIKEINIEEEKGYEIQLLYLGKYLKDIEGDDNLVLNEIIIPETEFKKQLIDFGLIENEKIKTINTKKLYNIFKNYEKETKKNIIIAEFYIKPDQVNEDVKIINSFDAEERFDVNLEGYVYPKNEQEIMDNIEIKINGKKIDFSYTHKFPKEGIYKIEYSFKNNLTKINYLFYSCYCLTNINLSNFNTHNVVNMEKLFYFCSSLENINLSSFYTENVTDMNEMFLECNSLTNIDLSNFNTQNVTKMNGMFSGCKSLTNLNLSNFNTEKVDDMREMFSLCESLISLDLSNFNCKNVEYMDEMFEGCSSLKKENVITKDNKILGLL